MKLFQPKEGYRYNSDTVMLYSFITKLKGNVLDVGCGCGILGLLLKRDFSNISLTMIDILQTNINMAIKNANENNIKADIISGNFLDMNEDVKFDYIVSNPPFYHDGAIKSKNLHKNFSRYSSNLNLQNFLEKSFKILKPNGTLIFCYDAKQINDIFFLLRNLKFNTNKVQFVHPKATKNTKLVLIEARKNSKSLCEILPPIFVNCDDGYSSLAKEIFAKADLLSVDYE
ncbi:methyltransferase [Campylobacter sp. RM12327]|uniref:tRNA1(Val) (adenine(37)-N6)-methyltransferase n=1 Tax=Campylobacter sputorum TaxID=206 RepID=UPI000B784952|nr:MULTISPECIES: methyltransferase [Campylobacter]ASM40204.1 tRNA m6A37 methyltransferase TrmN6 [Campylobacter sputorum]MBE7358490.1 methyltransferase [Campylobacter sp. RM11302]MBF6669733.1 methyltransferase [Campylobacter sp. RM12327]MBF6674979.1 methyltransferase [Campylobacter sp. RM13538]MBF6676321.1 methyltransferase [Campylobacter sp. RM12321]